jgi:orotidine-5'-phosphate decarboxylase
MNFQQKLEAAIQKTNSLVCVGLDSDITKLPERVKTGPHPQATFNKAIVYATQDLICAYKPNVAFYEARGAEGIEELKMTCDYIREHYPELLIILDAKRADIGNTNEGYVAFAFDYLGADAITLHPYLGREAIKPFLDRKDKGCIILCRTSNPGAGEFQDIETNEGKPLYRVVAEKIASEWNYNENCALVVGATYPDEIAIVRSIVGDMPFLIPGVGAQGGDVEATVKAGIDSKKQGAIINASRSIIFASNGFDYAHGSVYINKDALYPHTDLSSKVGEMFAEKNKDLDIDVVVAPALGGIILSQWTAFHLSKLKGKEIFGIYTEKDAEKNQVFTRGYDKFVAGKNVLVIEDLTTTGGSVL